MQEHKELSSYFNKEELQAASKYIGIFHGKMLISNELSRMDAVLLGTYMTCNDKKTSDVALTDLKTFITQNLAYDKVQLTKGLSDAKRSKLITVNSDKISLSFEGLNKIRALISSESLTAPTPVPHQIEAGDFPSISTPKTIKEGIMELLSTDWGKKPRTLKEISSAFEINAIYFPDSSIRAMLTLMTQSSDLRRIKKPEGFAYILKRRPPTST